MFFIIYAPLQFFLLYRLCPSAQFSVVNDLFQSMYSRSFVQIRKIKGKSCITCQIVVDIWKSSTATGKVNSLFCNMIGNLWWCTFQKCFHFCRDLIYAIGDSLINNIGGNNFFSGKSGNTVNTNYLTHALSLVAEPSHNHFQSFGCTCSQLKIVPLADLRAYGFIHLSAPDRYLFADNNPSSGDDGHLCTLCTHIYNHISGDGREYVITDSSAQKLRSEDGRFIKDVDISLFINDLPNKKDTLCFSTEDASGSTSQAAGIVESMEAGSKVFLLDEDTSATNFMVRDSFMQRVICREKEPITPFLERARDLYEKAGISTILVAGSSGAFFHIADTVIQMDNYHPVDITEITGKLCQEYPLSDVETPAFRLPESHRIMTRSKAAPSRHSRPGQPERLKTKVHGKDGFSLGKTEVDLRYVEQLIDSEQTASLALLLKYACEHLIDGKRTLPEIVTYLDSQLKKQGLSFFSEGSYISCGYAMPRIQEIYSCFNRYRRP